LRLYKHPTKIRAKPSVAFTRGGELFDGPGVSGTGGAMRAVERVLQLPWMRT
jgi:hypothetical protein